MNGNLPPWKGASAVYSRAYRILANLNRTAATAQMETARKRRRAFHFDPPEEARELIEALGKGNEEHIKGLVLNLIRYL